ncbi:MAG: M55 family metallopeptidase [Defluviitaleaceae bacterium]|nr:M55 family metallopeptidase [Defluviitaleaceae bacterium]
MRALLIADIEGIIGVYDFINESEKSADLYTQEIEIYIKGLLANGVSHITVCDAHNKGDMIKSSIISKNIDLISGTRNVSFEEQYDFAIMVGYHGMEGQPGIHPHTYRFDIKEILADGVPVGEVEVICRWLGSHGIPVILITGDREATYEANYYNPYRATCCTKSLFQNKFIDHQFLYDKLLCSIDAALNLEKNLCLSPDTNTITVEFYNPDIVSMLEEYEIIENKLIFKNCADFENSVTSLALRLNEINLHIIEVNTAFLNEMRKYTKHLSKKALMNSGIAQHLTKNRYFLDEAAKCEIRKVIDELVNP